MHDVLRQRLIRTIESLPDEQIYQVLDYIEFLESKYGEQAPPEASGLQKFAEGLEDKLRKKAVSPSTIREAFQLISAADKVLSGVSARGKQILTDLNQALEAQPGEPSAPSEGERIEADPSKTRRTPPGPTRAESPQRSGAPERSSAGGEPPTPPAAAPEASTEDADEPVQDTPVEGDTQQS